MNTLLLAIDQGTTNSRAIIFDQMGNMLAQYELPLANAFPRDGWVEQDPEEMFNNTVVCCREVMKKIKNASSQIAAIGISNQRETTIIWDKQTGKPIYPAIVWQDRRTSDICQRLASQPIGSVITAKTGLLLDPYFSATKIMWLLENVPGAKERAKRGELLFGTVDTYLIWRLTAGKSHVTDATNASRTMLFNLETQQWDDDILQALSIPSCLLPTVLDNAGLFGHTDSALLGTSFPITGVAGDQQAATVGQACFLPGMMKATYGTGGFMLLNTGHQIVQSQNQLLATMAYRLNGLPTYGLEGSIFCAGATIKWLRDTLKLIRSAEESEHLAKSLDDNEGVYLVPAFTGLGAPYWNPDVRAVISGLGRGTQPAHIARAALESVAYQTKDLLTAMLSDTALSLTRLRVDGGMVMNQWLLQFLSDMLQVTIERPHCIETSALGAAFLAGFGVGLYSSLESISECWKMHSSFQPELTEKKRELFYVGWQQAIWRLCQP